MRRPILRTRMTCGSHKATKAHSMTLLAMRRSRPWQNYVPGSPYRNEFQELANIRWQKVPPCYCGDPGHLAVGNYHHLTELHRLHSCVSAGFVQIATLAHRSTTTAWNSALVVCTAPCMPTLPGLVTSRRDSAPNCPRYTGVFMFPCKNAVFPPARARPDAGKVGGS